MIGQVTSARSPKRRILGKRRSASSTCVMLLLWPGEHRDDPEIGLARDAVTAAVDTVLSDPASRTADRGGTMGTRAFGSAVGRQVEGHVNGVRPAWLSRSGSGADKRLQASSVDAPDLPQ